MNTATSKISLEAALVLAGAIGMYLLYMAQVLSMYEPGSLTVRAESASHAYFRWVVLCSPFLLYVVSFLMDASYAKSRFGRFVLGVLVVYVVFLSAYLHRIGVVHNHS